MNEFPEVVKTVHLNDNFNRAVNLYSDGSVDIDCPYMDSLLSLTPEEAGRLFRALDAGWQR